MKRFIRSYLINITVIYITTLFIPGVSYSNNYKILFLAALAFGLVNMFAKPFLKVIFLPVNILTLGLFSWVLNVILLYITTIVVPGFEVKTFDFSGITIAGFVIPAAKITKLYATIIASFFISFLGRFLYWIVK